MYLMYYEDAEGKKVYTLQVLLWLEVLPMHCSVWQAADRPASPAENLSHWPAVLVSPSSSVLTR